MARRGRGPGQRRQLTSDLGQLSDRMVIRSTDAVAKAAADIEAGAKMRCPVDTGFLRSTIGHRMTGPRRAEVTVMADYGHFVENGTRHMAAQPYLAPAVEQARQPFHKAMRAIFDDG